MSPTRRATLRSLLSLSSPFLLRAQEEDRRRPRGEEPPPETDRLPNGKSQKDAIAKELHDQALKDTEDLIALAEELRDEIKRAGQFVVSVSSVKKTEEIEKLARRIRGKLKF